MSSATKIFTTPVAKSVPFDKTGVPFLSDDTQAAIEELRKQVITTPEYYATSLNGTLTLTNTSNSCIFLTGTGANYTVKLPNATTLNLGHRYEIVNASSQVTNINYQDNTLFFNLGQTSIGFLTLQDNSTANGVWVFWQTFLSVASGIVNYKITSSTPFATSSSSDVVITGFSLTPVAGTYAVWYDASVFFTNTPRGHLWSIYRGGVKVTDTERRQDTSHSNQTMHDATLGTIQFDGTQTCDVRVRRFDVGTLTVNDRTLLLIRLGT